MNVISSKKAEQLPDELNDIISSFLPTDRLDLWQNKADEVLPPVVLNSDNKQEFYKFVSNESIIHIREYYKSQPAIILDVIENIIWLGLSNLYCGFNSNHTIEYIKDIIELMIKEGVDLPAFDKVKMLSVSERRGWGEYTEIQKYL